MSKSAKRFLAYIAIALCTMYAFRLLWIRVSGNHAISFYGRVIDDNNVGLSNVQVEFQILYSDRPVIPLPYGRVERVKTVMAVTDEDGDFELSGYYGYGISIRSFRKNGIYLDWAVPPRSPGRPPQTFSYDDNRSRLILPDTPNRRLSYPLAVP